MPRGTCDISYYSTALHRALRTINSNISNRPTCFCTNNNISNSPTCFSTNNNRSNSPTCFSTNDHRSNSLTCFRTNNNIIKIVSKSSRMHLFASLLLKFSQQFQLQEHRFKQRQNAPYIVLDFKMFSGVPNSAKNIFIASECTIYCPFLHHFLIRFNFQKHRSKCARMHLLVSLVSKLSQQCQLWFIGQCFM